MVDFSKNTYISAEHSINHLQNKTMMECSVNNDGIIMESLTECFY